LYKNTQFTGGDYVYTSWDLAEKESERNDYTVGQLWVMIGEKSFLVAQVRGRYDLIEKMAQFESLESLGKPWEARSRNQIKHLIEDASGGSGLATTLEKIKGVRNIELLRRKKDNDKTQRVIDASIYFTMRKVYREMDTRLDEWDKEITSYPYASNDDQVDATTQALIYHRDNKKDPKVMTGCEMPVRKEFIESRGAFLLENRYGVNLRVSNVRGLFDDD
jgi:predicted phage terminase large subunit-like protein